MTTSTPESSRRSPQQAGAADLLGPKTVLETQEQGRNAALSGEHVSVCPFTRSDPRTVALREMWARGYAAGLTELRAARMTAPPQPAARQSPPDASPST